MRPKVFLSSTAVGLSEFRDVARKAIEDCGCDVTGMETFGAEAEFPDQVCRKKVLDSDLLVGVLGWRYGSVPAGSDKSFTEREWLVARAEGLPCLFFVAGTGLRQPELEVGTPEAPDFIQRQERFRRNVQGGRTGYTTAAYADFTSLADAVSTALDTHLSTKPWGIRGLVGRDEQLAGLRRQLVDENRNIVLAGLPGIGKSALSAAFVTWMRRESARPSGDRNVQVWSAELQDSLRRSSEPNLAVELSALETQVDPEIGPAIRGANAETVVGLLEKAVDRAPGRVVLVLDNVWPAHEPELERLMQRLAGRGSVTFLVTTRFPELLTSLGGRRGLRFRREHVEPIAGEFAAYLLASLVAAGAGETRGSAAGDDQALDDFGELEQSVGGLATRIGGFPMALEIVAAMLLRGATGVAHLRRRADQLEARLTKEVGSAEATPVDEVYDALLEFVTAPDVLPNAALDVLRALAILAPKPASFSLATLDAYWANVVEAGALDITGTPAEKALYAAGDDAEEERNDAFHEVLDILVAAQLVAALDLAADVATRDDESQRARFSIHAVVSEFARRTLLSNAEREGLEAAAASAFGSRIDELALDSFTAMFNMESLAWQEIVASWLYHLARLANIDPVKARFELARAYLDAFWWFGCYEEFAFCDLIIDALGQMTVPAEQLAGHRRFLQNLRQLHNRYPRGWKRNGTDMAPVGRALQGVAEDIGVDLASSADDIAEENKLHVYGIIQILLSYCDATSAESRLEAAQRAFERVGTDFESDADEWNVVWSIFERADHASQTGRLDEARRLCKEADEHERAREGGMLWETLANIARVQADVAARAGDLAEEADRRALAGFYAYAFQVRPPQSEFDTEGDLTGGPDAYTDAFYREQRDRCVERILELVEEGSTEAAAGFGEAVAAFWKPFWQSSEVELVAAAIRSANVSTLSADAVSAALFPPGFDHAKRDAAAYVREGCALADGIEERLEAAP